MWKSLPASVAEAPDLALFKRGCHPGGCHPSHSMLGRGQSASRVRGFWSCDGWVTDQCSKKYAEA